MQSQGSSDGTPMREPRVPTPVRVCRQESRSFQHGSLIYGQQGLCLGKGIAQQLVFLPLSAICYLGLKHLRYLLKVR